MIIDRNANNGVPLHEIDDMLRYELMQVALHNITFRRCACCGQPFTPDDRKDEKYCGRIRPEQKKPCSAIGAYALSNEKRDADTAAKAYRQAYDRMYKRMEAEYIPMTQFDGCNEQARVKRDEC